jgi:maltose/moltooligosaccharide transporter
MGAVAFFGAVLWTIMTTKEYPPEDLVAFRRRQNESTGLGANAREIVRSIAETPRTMRQLAAVQFFTWLGLFCMWLYFVPAVAHNVFGAPDPDSPLYAQGVEWGGVCFGFYSFVCFAFSWMLPALAARLGRRATHAVCLLCGACGLLSVAIIQSKWLLLGSMVGVGIAWASTLSMPYAILAGCLPPEKTGIYMGIFNFAIVLPEILASLVFGWVMANFLHENRLLAVVAGGVFMILAATLMSAVEDVSAVRPRATAPAQAGARS